VASKKRSIAAKKGWETRRKRAELAAKAKRSAAAKKGWETRRERAVWRELIETRGLPRSPARSERERELEEKVRRLEARNVALQSVVEERITKPERMRIQLKKHRDAVKRALQNRLAGVRSQNPTDVVGEVKIIWYEFQDFDFFEDEREIWDLYDEIYS